VLITSHGSVETAIKAIRRGAYDYLRKPFQQLEDVWLTVLRALEKRDLSLRVNDLVLQQIVHGAEISHTVDRLAPPEPPVVEGCDTESAETPIPVGDSDS
jgi:DNA-binding NtrC family response regulator